MQISSNERTEIKISLVVRTNQNAKDNIDSRNWSITKEVDLLVPEKPV